MASHDLQIQLCPLYQNRTVQHGAVTKGAFIPNLLEMYKHFLCPREDFCWEKKECLEQEMEKAFSGSPLTSVWMYKGDAIWYL